MYVYRVHAETSGGQKKVPDPLKLDVQARVSYRGGTGNQNQVLFESNKCF